MIPSSASRWIRQACCRCCINKDVGARRRVKFGEESPGELPGRERKARALPGNAQRRPFPIDQRPRYINFWSRRLCEECRKEEIRCAKAPEPRLYRPPRQVYRETGGGYIPPRSFYMAMPWRNAPPAHFYMEECLSYMECAPRSAPPPASTDLPRFLVLPRAPPVLRARHRCPATGSW